MEKRVLSSCHSLKLIPITGLSKFAVYDNRVRLVALVSPIDAGAIPGSIKVANTVEDGKYKARITFSRAAADVDTINRLKDLGSVRLVATYIDEAGNSRIAGSPDYPLTLEVNEAGGVITGTLTGEAKFIPPFLEVL